MLPQRRSPLLQIVWIVETYRSHNFASFSQILGIVVAIVEAGRGENQVAPDDIVAPNDVKAGCGSIAPHHIVAPNDVQSAERAIEYCVAPNYVFAPHNVVAPHDVLNGDPVAVAR